MSLNGQKKIFISIMKNIFLISDFLKISKHLDKTEKFFLLVSFVFSILVIFLEMIGISLIPILIINYLDAEQSIFNNIFFYYLKTIDLSSLLILICVIFFIKASLNYAHQIYDFSITKKIRLNILNKIFLKNLNKDYLDLSKTPSSHKIWLIDITRIFCSLLVTYLTLLKSLILMFSISIFVLATNFFYFSIFFLIIGIFLISFYSYYKKKVLEFGKKAIVADREVKKVVHESFEGIKNVIIYNLYHFFTDNFNNKSKQQENFTQKNLVITQLPLNYIELIAVCFLTFFIFVSLEQKLDQGDFIFSLGIISVGCFRLLSFLKLALLNYNAIKTKNYVIDVVLSELEIQHSTKNKRENNFISHSNKNENSNVVIKIKNLLFNYPNTTKKLIDLKEFEFKDKRFYIVRGESGCGKSTLLDILMGVILPQKGQIIYNLKDLKIGYVSQECFLINDSLKKNIAFGISDNLIDERKINNVLKKVGLKDRFFSNGQGLETMIDASGSNLSVGQKQRIGIARSLYFDPEIIFLDEPTSALDLQNEKIIVDILNELSKDICVIMISHKDINIQNSEVIKFENGSLINSN